MIAKRDLVQAFVEPPQPANTIKTKTVKNKNYS